MLGANPRRVFFRVALPHARPAIAGGIALALMETAADFGVVDFFGVATLTNGIFRTWYAQGEHQAAMQMAGWLFVVVAVLIVFEQLARRGSHANPVSRNVATVRKQTRGWQGYALSLMCLVPFLLGFGIPGGALLQHAILVGDPLLDSRFLGYLGNTALVASIAAVITTVCAIWLSYSVRLQQHRRGGRVLGLSVRVATLG